MCFLFCRQDSYARTVLHAIESMIIKWSHQIRDIVQRDSVQLLLHGIYPDPQTELTFWKARKDDLLCIHDQVSDFRYHNKYDGKPTMLFFIFGWKTCHSFQCFIFANTFEKIC